MHFPSAQRCHRNVTHPCCSCEGALGVSPSVSPRTIKSQYATLSECRAPPWIWICVIVTRPAPVRRDVDAASPPHGPHFHAPRPELSSFHRERRRASGIPAERGAAETRFSSGLTDQWTVDASFLPLCVCPRWSDFFNPVLVLVLRTSGPSA